MAGAWPDDHEAGADQQRPQNDKSDIKAADELAERSDDAWSALGNGACLRGEDREGRATHDVIRDLEHQPDERFDTSHDRSARLAHCGERDPEEYREDYDRQDLVRTHSLEDRLRTEMRDEILA